MRSERDEIRKVKKKSFLGCKTWYRDICYVGCAEKPLMHWRDHSDSTYPLWLWQNWVSVRTAREIPQKKDFLWQVHWPWLTRNAKEMSDLRRDLKRPCYSVPTFSQPVCLQCPIPLQSQKRQQTADSNPNPVSWVWVSQFFAQYVKHLWGPWKFISQAWSNPDIVLTCSDALYKPQYFNTVRSNKPSQSCFFYSCQKVNQQ